MYDSCTFLCCNQISKRSMAWITKLKMFKWIASLKSVRHAVTKMVSILCSQGTVIPPDGFLFVHPVRTFLISVLLYKVGHPRCRAAQGLKERCALGAGLKIGAKAFRLIKTGTRRPSFAETSADKQAPRLNTCRCLLRRTQLGRQGVPAYKRDFASNFI